jgi:hypothetical protein
LSDLVATELQPGHTVEFDTSRISSVRVQEMQQLRYFGDGVGRVPGAKEIPEPEGELVVFEAFFIAGLRLPVHRFVAEVLRRFDVQVHQLTPNAVVALAKYVWAVASYGGQPSVEVFAKNYCLHWQKKKIGDKIAQFGSCTIMPRTGKTSAKVVEIVPSARNKWGNWWDFWFYVSCGEVEGLPCDTPGVYFASCWEINPNLGCSVKISISRSCLSLFIRLSLGSSPNSELIDREKQPILERVKTFNSRN